MDRRFFLRLTAMAAATSLANWRFAGAAPKAPSAAYNAIVVGAGLGGLSCAAHLAQSGFKTLLLEQYGVPGGYATSFTREAKGRIFSCEVSLHSSSLRSPDMRALLTGLGVFDALPLVEHEFAWSSRFPEFSLDVPARTGLNGFERQLTGLFPGEAKGLEDFFSLWRGVMDDMDKLQAAPPGASRLMFPLTYKNLWYIRDKTLGELVDARVSDARAKAVLTQSCGYFGLPPSRLSAFYYLIPMGGYLQFGGQYVKGTSQVLSNALARAIEKAGGEIRYGEEVASLVMMDGRAAGVRTVDGKEYLAQAVICNASAPQVFSRFLPPDALPGKERERLERSSNSPGSCIVWLGLDKDVSGLCDSAELSFYPNLDMEATYAAAMENDFTKSGFSLMVYDKLVPGFSPPGCSTVSLTALCGFGHWKPFEKDYFAGRKTAYDAEKERLTGMLIAQAEKLAIKGLSQMIVMRESSTPLTNKRYTLNTAGAIYGFNQTVDNSFMTRQPNETGLPGLYLASAWGDPGGGFGGAIMGGKNAFKAVATTLTKPSA